MSFKSEVIADSSGKWVSNALRFATREEAAAYGRDLGGRWLSVRETRVAESNDPVSHAWINGRVAQVFFGDESDRVV
jgi:hypothetical protein